MPVSDTKIETQKNNLRPLKSHINSKFKTAFNFGGKTMFSNFKNFYEEFVNNNTKTGNKANLPNAQNESIKFPIKTLEKLKENYKSISRK